MMFVSGQREGRLTNFHVSYPVQEDVVTLDVTVDDVLAV